MAFSWLTFPGEPPQALTNNGASPKAACRCRVQRRAFDLAASSVAYFPAALVVLAELAPSEDRLSTHAHFPGVLPILR